MIERQASAPSISCVMPAYNEGRHLTHVVTEVLSGLRDLSPAVELILVDDGSRDDTAAVARELADQQAGVVVLELTRNFGKEAALTAGMAATHGDVVVVLDADGQHPVALVAEMLAHWRSGADVVYAVRRVRDDQSSLYAGLTAWFYRFVNWGNRVKIPANAGDFRLMDRQVVNALMAMPERNRFMKGLYAWVGYRSAAIDYEPLPRTDGRSRFGLRGGVALAVTGIVAFSTAPLRLLTLLGFLLSVSSLGYGTWVTLAYFIWGNDVPGYTTIVVSMLFLSGIQLLSIGILAEYVGRIYEEVKQRPAYLVRQRSGRGLPSRLSGPAP
jgi:polyisoprenyl-phosphate glycosyltransferase